MDGVGPAIVEHVLALAVVLEVAGHDGEGRAVGVAQLQVLAEPAGVCSGRAGLLECRQEGMAHERIVRLAGRIGARVPVLRRDGRQRLVNLDDILAGCWFRFHGDGGR
jgi:hypothetical protein